MKKRIEKPDCSLSFIVIALNDRHECIEMQVCQRISFNIGICVYVLYILKQLRGQPLAGALELRLYDGICIIHFLNEMKDEKLLEHF